MGSQTMIRKTPLSIFNVTRLYQNLKSQFWNLGSTYEQVNWHKTGAEETNGDAQNDPDVPDKTTEETYRNSGKSVW